MEAAPRVTDAGEMSGNGLDEKQEGPRETITRTVNTLCFQGAQYLGQQRQGLHHQRRHAFRDRLKNLSNKHQ